jgi:hypothetical protein
MKKKKIFDIEELSVEQIKELSVKLGEQVRHICDKSVAQANKILNKFGMECKMAFHIDKLGSFDQKENDEQKKAIL